MAFGSNNNDRATFLGMLGRLVINSARLFAWHGCRTVCARKSSTKFDFLQDTSTVRMVVLSDDAPHLTYECHISI